MSRVIDVEFLERKTERLERENAEMREQLKEYREIVKGWEAENLTTDTVKLLRQAERTLLQAARQEGEDDRWGLCEPVARIHLKLADLLRRIDNGEI